VSLEDSKTGQPFATCPVQETGPYSIERALDSSRYFIIHVDDGKGNHAYLGVGFENREEGFDFQHSISEHFRFFFFFFSFFIFFLFFFSCYS
jgi:CCR4-NOT complex subunit CAF16